MKNLHLILFVLISMFFTACLEKNKTANEAEDIAAIRELYDTYRDYVNTEDLEGFLALWTEDCIKSDPDLPPIRGKADLTRYFSHYFTNFDMDMAFVSNIQVEVDGDLAYAFGIVNYSSVPFSGGDTAIIDMKALGILKRQEDGSWKIYIDHVNYQPAFTADYILWELFEEDNPYY